jgi:outer membrane protein assembly factor BamE (lipoprotein component of BamABCDE complex)
MKRFVLLLTCAVLVLSFAGCASDKAGGEKAAQEKQKDPEVGMTKEQIVAMYGKASNVQVSSEGETWFYHLNQGQMYIPFNFGYRPKTRLIMFSKEGKVAHWSYSK